MLSNSVNSATKAAIRSFARTWTVDLKQRKIRVNAVSPGAVDTPGQALYLPDEQFKQLKTSIVNATPLGRMGNPDEIAKAVAFLASDDSSYITGIELFVDGGLAQIWSKLPFDFFSALKPIWILLFRKDTMA